MQRVVPSIDKSVRTQSTNPVVIPAITPTDVLPDITTSAGEWAGRFIQNIGANACYFKFGGICAGAPNANGLLNVGDSINCTGERVSVYSTAGTTIATLVLTRQGL